MGLIKPAGLGVLQVKKTHFWVKPLVAEKSSGYYNTRLAKREQARGQMAGRYPASRRRRGGDSGDSARALVCRVTHAQSWEPADPSFTEGTVWISAPPDWNLSSSRSRTVHCGRGRTVGCWCWGVQPVGLQGPGIQIFLPAWDSHGAVKRKKKKNQTHKATGLSRLVLLHRESCWTGRQIAHSLSYKPRRLFLGPGF